jgi:Fur family ferric uptake transcriptional regulator
MAVLRALDDGHALSAQQVFTRARDHCPALTAAGLLDEIGTHEGEATYRLCSDHHHHHLVCTECRRVEELEDCDLSPIEARIAADYDFRVDGHSVTFQGVCRACRDRRSS